MELKKKKKVREEAPTLQLVSVLEDVLPLENRRIFNRLVSSIDSMSDFVPRHHIQEVFPIHSHVSRTLH